MKSVQHDKSWEDAVVRYVLLDGKMIFIIRNSAIYDTTLSQDNGLQKIFTNKEMFCISHCVWYKNKSMVSCQKGPTRDAYAWQIGPFWQDTLEMFHFIVYRFMMTILPNTLYHRIPLLWHPYNSYVSHLLQNPCHSNVIHPITGFTFVSFQKSNCSLIPLGGLWQSTCQLWWPMSLLGCFEHFL